MCKGLRLLKADEGGAVRKRGRRKRPCEVSLELRLRYLQVCKDMFGIASVRGLSLHVNTVGATDELGDKLQRRKVAQANCCLKAWIWQESGGFTAVKI